MKKAIILLVLMVMLSTVLMAWQQHLQNDNKSLRKLRRCGNIVYGAYDKGYFKSNAAGTSFNYYPATDNDSITFYSAWMFDENNIILGGQIEWEYYHGHGVFFKTTNGGQTWTRKDILQSISIPPYGRRMVKDLEFRNSNIGFALTGSNLHGPEVVPDQIHFTSNGGQTWNGVSFPSETVTDVSFSGPFAAYAIRRANGTCYLKYSSSPSGNGWINNNFNWESTIDFLNYDNETDRWVINVKSSDSQSFYLAYTNQASGIANQLGDWTAPLVGALPINSVFNFPIIEQHGNDLYATLTIHSPQNSRLAIAKSENFGDWHVFIDWLPLPYNQANQDSSITGLIYANGQIYICNNEKLLSYQVEVATDDQTESPELISNLGCYPNPFRENTKIKFKNTRDAKVEINIFNIKGQLIKKILDKTVDSGEHQFVWNGKKDNNQPAAAGIYFYNIKSGRYSKTGKILLLK